MFYIIYRDVITGNVNGFITDDNTNTPACFETIAEAEFLMQQHILESVSEVIDL